MNPEDRMRDLMRGADGAERPSEAEWDVFVGRAHRSLALHRALSVAAAVVVLALGAIGGRAIVNAASSESNFDPAKSPTSTETEGQLVPGPTETTPVPEQTETGAPVRTTVVQQWFFREGDDGFAELVLDHATIAATEGIGRAALEELIGGPPPEGLGTGISPDTEILGLTIEDGTARVDLSDDFHNSGLGTTADGIQISQVTATLLQFDTVSRVVFLIEGEEPELLGGHGIIVENPYGLQDIDKVLPTIVLEWPYPNEKVDPTFTVEGTANVFEANVSYRLVDADGAEVDYIARDETGARVPPGFTTATCGSGCRGRFSFTVDLTQETEFVTVEVFQASAEDGSPMDVVRVPIRIDL